MTELKIKNLKPRDKKYMLSDGRGLWLRVDPNGRKYFIFRFTENKKERQFSLGVYPIVGLKDARAKCDELLKMRDKGDAPAEILNATKEAVNLSFEFIAREWIDKRLKGINTKNHVRAVTNRLKYYIFPILGSKKLQCRRFWICCER